MKIPAKQQQKHPAEWAAFCAKCAETKSLIPENEPQLWAWFLAGWRAGRAV